MKQSFYCSEKKNYKIKMILIFIFNASQISTLIFFIMISYAFFRNFF